MSAINLYRAHNLWWSWQLMPCKSWNQKNRGCKIYGVCSQAHEWCENDNDVHKKTDNSEDKDNNDKDNINDNIKEDIDDNVNKNDDDDCIKSIKVES